MRSIQDTAKLIAENSYLKALPPKEAAQLPYVRLADKLRLISCHKFPRPFLTELEKRQLFIANSTQYFVEKNEVPGKSKTAALVALLKAYYKYHGLGEISLSWQAVRDFWYRVHGNKSIQHHSDTKKLLNPICRLCGFQDFEDFLNKEFKLSDEVFKILILPFTGDILNRNDAETILQKRYLEIARKEKLPLLVEFIVEEKQAFHTSASARKIGLKYKAAIVIYGDLFLRNEEKLALQYVIVSESLPIKQSEWNSQPQTFKFSQLQQGHLQSKIDYIIYWILGIQAFYRNQLKKSLRYFTKIIKAQSIDEEVYYRLAVLYDLAGKTKEAKQAYSKALAFAPNHYPSLLNAGINALLDNELQEAKRLLAHFQKNFNNKKDSLFNISIAYLGVACKHLGEFQLAETNLIAITNKKSKGLDASYNEIWAMAHYELAELLSTVDEPDSLSEKKILFHLKKSIELTSKKDILSLIQTHEKWQHLFPELFSLLQTKSGSLNKIGTRSSQK